MKSIVTISGTSRPDNYTSRALAVVNAELRELDCEIKSFDGRELSLTFPGHEPTDDARALAEAVKASSGIIFATPEYHGTFSAMTKLIIENLGFPSAPQGKAVGLVGVAAGRIGAIKSLEQLRGVCSHTGAVVMPSSVSIAGVRGAFDDHGAITDEGAGKALRGFADSFVKFIGDYVCPKQILEMQARESGAPWTATV
jgi:NAD(P)H-dependent FMN reductase